MFRLKLVKHPHCKDCEYERSKTNWNSDNNPKQAPSNCREAYITIVIVNKYPVCMAVTQQNNPKQTDQKLRLSSIVPFFRPIPYNLSNSPCLQLPLSNLLSFVPFFDSSLFSLPVPMSPGLLVPFPVPSSPFFVPFLLITSPILLVFSSPCPI